MFKGALKSLFFFLFETEQNTGLSAMPSKEYVAEEIFLNYPKRIGI